MKFIISLILITFALNLNSFAQQSNKHFCGSDIYHEQLFKENPGLKEQIQIENLTRDLTPYRIQKRESVRVIPVVFHIIHQGGAENISDADIQGVLKRINEDFRKLNPDTSEIRQIFKARTTDMNIEFRLAKIDPYGKCTNGIQRIYSTLTENARDNVKNLKDENTNPIAWDNLKYLNVYVVKSIYNYSGVGVILGYSYYPQIALSDPKKDGIVIRADVTNYNGRTLTHELGHYFGLPHTFQDGCGSDCKTTGDLICDTPPVLEDTYGCDKTKNSCNSDVPDEPDMAENHMDYTNCRVMFTKGQKEVVDYYLNSQYRNNLFKSSNLTATGTDNATNISCKPVANFELKYYAYCSGSPVTFTDKSLGPDNMQYKWYLPGSTNEVFIGKNPSVTYYFGGKYNVKLVVKSASGSDSMVKDNYIFVYPETGEDVTFEEKFEESSFKSNYWFIEPAQSNIQWKKTSAAAFEGKQSFLLNNFANATEREYSFITPPLNLKQVNAPYLLFNYAHARKDDASKDMLRIYVSTDCGVNWSLRDITNHIKLPTAANFVANQFIPQAEDWKYKFVDISNYQGKENVLIKIALYGNGGNNFYLDNLKIYSSVAIKEVSENQNSVHLYPNPANNLLNVDFASDNYDEATISINDINGKTLKQIKVKTNYGNNHIAIDLSDISNNGLYFLVINNSTGIQRKPFNLIRQ